MATKWLSIKNINPEKKYSFEIQLLTGVTNADVAAAPYFDEAMTIFNLFRRPNAQVCIMLEFDGPARTCQPYKMH